VDHGAPAFAAYTPEFGAICEQLQQAGVLQQPEHAYGSLGTDGDFVGEAISSAPQRYSPGPGKGMSALR
jgi:predicted NAD/FAD-dependent oxidoreductase